MFHFSFRLFILFWAQSLFAHGLYDRLGSRWFELKWDWDPALLFFLLLAFLYGKGLRAFRGKRPVKTWQIFCFYFGVAIAVISLLPPIDPLSDQLFFVHMIQHMMITAISAPLLLAGVPFYICLRGIHPWIRRYIYFPLVKNRLNRLLLYWIHRPLVTLILFQGAFLFWHIPRFYNLALVNDFYHLIEHACFAMTSILLWKQIIDPAPLRSPLPLPLRILYVGAVMASNIMLSAFLTFSESIWYAYEGRPIPEWWTWGHLGDQRLGGLIMWVPGELLNFVTMTVIFFVWVQKQENRHVASNGHAIPQT